MNRSWDLCCLLPVPRRQRVVFACGWIVLLTSGAVPAQARQSQLTASVAVTTDYVHHGLTQSSGEPAFQAGVGLRLPEGLYFNVWGSTLDLSELGPDFGDGSGIETDFMIGFGRPLGLNWRWDLNAGRYIYFAEDRNLDYDYTEFGGSLVFLERLRLGVSWSPEATDHTRRVEPELLRGPRTVVELSGEWPLTRWVSLAGGYGYNDAREVSDVEYTYWSAGANLRWRGWALGLSHYATDADARARWPDGRAADRFAATLVLSFG